MATPANDAVLSMRYSPMFCTNFTKKTCVSVQTLWVHIAARQGRRYATLHWDAICMLLHIEAVLLLTAKLVSRSRYR